MELKSNILVVDDEAGIREGCRRVLQPQGFSVETATTLKEGISKIQEGHFDLVLLDVMMPDGRGIDLLGPIHEKDPDTISVIITGYATVELAIEAIKRGAYDFISKPFTADLLLMTVNQGLEKRHLSLEAKRLQTIEKEAAELVQAKEEAERLNEFKSAFVLMVAHELRSPVGGAQSLLRTITRGMAGKINEQQKEILTRVEIRLNALLELINDLLTLAASKSIEADKPLEHVPLQPVIQRIIDRLSVEAENKKITMAFHAPEKAPVVQATEDGLEIIFGNIVSNAIKYTTDQGNIRVEVVEENDKARIAISDTGMGIPAGALPHIGDEFFRAQNAKKTGIVGTGLGLSIVKQFVDHFGGQINIESVEGKGTTFTVILPLAKTST
jgi:signal transduction histidine kinase